MDFFKYFHFGLKRKYKYLLFGIVVALLVFNLLSLFGYCSTDFIFDDTKTIIDDNMISESEAGGTGIGYFYCPSSGVLTITSYLTSSTRAYFYAGSINVGDSVSKLGTLMPNATIQVNIDSPCYVVIPIYSENQMSKFDLSFESSTSFGNTMEKLVNDVSADSMWTVFSNSISYVAVSILVGIGFWFVIRLIDLVSKKGNR